MNYLNIINIHICIYEDIWTTHKVLEEIWCMKWGEKIFYFASCKRRGTKKSALWQIMTDRPSNQPTDWLTDGRQTRTKREVSLPSKKSWNNWSDRKTFWEWCLILTVCYTLHLSFICHVFILFRFEIFEGIPECPILQTASSVYIFPSTVNIYLSMRLYLSAAFHLYNLSFLSRFSDNMLYKV